MSRELWHYFKAGMVERGSKYEWRDSYSRVTHNATSYPWLTFREAQSFAKKNNAKAVFHPNKEAARKAISLSLGVAAPSLDTLAQLR